MAYHYLPLERTNEKIPAEYCYLEIMEYRDSHFEKSDKKRLTNDELKHKNDSISSQKETIKRLESGHFNCYNNSYEAGTILGVSPKITDDDFKYTNIYRIKPTAAKIKNEAYSSRKTYLISEFDVVKKITNQDELIEQLIKDNLIDKFSVCVFERYSCSNEGYSEILYGYFKKLHDNYPDIEITISDIILSDDYNHDARGKFRASSFYPQTEYNFKKILDDNLIKYTNEYDYYYADVVSTLVTCGMTEVALKYIESIPVNYFISIVGSKAVDAALRMRSSDEYVKKILARLDMKLSGVTLKITESQSYESDIVKEVRFENINELKTYLVKEYDVPFDTLSRPDISEFDHRKDEDSVYIFNIT